MLRDLSEVFLNLLKVTATMAGVCTALVVGAHFPRTIGPAVVDAIEEEEQAKDFYDVVYAPQDAVAADSDYVRTGLAMAHDTGVMTMLEEFIAEHELTDKRVLEVGAGSGSLQNLVDDYTGLDIAASAERYFHKPFVQGSALDLPFDDGAFDSIWTIWTLEHVPDPEKALEEMRRVVKPGGMLFVFPAWNSETWAPKGYQVRPYSDFGLWGKMVKASLAVRTSLLFRISWMFPIRLIRHGWWLATGAPTRLRYTAYEPNYTNYWQPDSDALASIDRHEAMLWFVSRGDECTNCPTTVTGAVTMQYEPLHIRVKK